MRLPDQSENMPMLSRRDLIKAAAALAIPVAIAGCGAASATTRAAPSATSAATAGTSGLLWGVATSAYQIEGAVTADGRGVSIWDTFSHTPGKIFDNQNGDVADDHYHRFVADLDLMQSLGIQSYRFSIAWPRILPQGAGAVNQAGLDFYSKLVDGILQRGMRPMATLFHWDLPQALQDQGGWENRVVAQRFADYAAVMYKALGDRVTTWLTLNEPKTVVGVGYIYGSHAPGIKDPHRAYHAMHHMLLGHGLAVQAFRSQVAQGQIGIALNLAPVYAAPNATNADAAVRMRDGYENRLYLDPILKGSYPADVMQDITQRQGISMAVIQPGDAATIGQPIDLLGVNYYNPVYVNAQGNDVQVQPTTVATWEQVYPQGLYDILMYLQHQYGTAAGRKPIPIAITENGRPVADQVDSSGQVQDPERISFLSDHFAACQRAIAAGVPVHSYHVWSFLDNFEWNEGYSQRWGIVYVDFTTQRRIPKQSALWYRDFIRSQPKTG